MSPNAARKKTFFFKLTRLDNAHPDTSAGIGIHHAQERTEAPGNTAEHLPLCRLELWVLI